MADNISYSKFLLRAIDENQGYNLDDKELAIKDTPQGSQLVYKFNKQEHVLGQGGSGSGGDVNYDDVGFVLDQVEEDGETKYTLTIASTEEGASKIITLPATGGGSGGVENKIAFENITGYKVFNVPLQSDVILKLRCDEHINGVTQDESCKLNITVQYSSSKTAENWTSLPKLNSAPGSGEEFDVTIPSSILEDGESTRIRVTATSNQTDSEASFEYIITPVEMYIKSDMASIMTCTGNLDFSFYCVGSEMNKVVHFLVDGDEVCTNDIKDWSSSNVTKTQTISMTEGSHTLEVYFTTNTGSRSNKLSYEILCGNSASSNKPFVGIILDSDKVQYGADLKGKCLVYYPGDLVNDTVRVTLKVYSSIDDSSPCYSTLATINKNRITSFQIPPYSYPAEAETLTVKAIIDEDHFAEATVTVQSDYRETLSQVSNGLVYHFTAEGKTNSMEDRDTYRYWYENPYFTSPDNIITYGIIEAKNANLNWASDGYVYIQDEDVTCLRLSGEDLHTINLPIFSTSFEGADGTTVDLRTENQIGETAVKAGRTFEVDFKVTNVSNLNAEVISCVNSKSDAGIGITPQLCYLLNGDKIDYEYADEKEKKYNTGFVKNESSLALAYLKDGSRVRVSFVIEPKLEENSTKQCINIYINGEFANSVPYTDTNFTYAADCIKIGSSTCVTNIYEIRVYKRALSHSEILKNYIASPGKIEDKISRVSENSVIDKKDKVSYDLAKNKYPCLLITGKLASEKKDEFPCGVTLTKPDGKGGCTLEFELLGKIENEKGDQEYVCKNKIQGTSSVKFPVKNYKVYLSEIDNDGSVKKYKYSLKGKDSNEKALSIGESTLCWKSDYMSSDHANTFNANLGDVLMKYLDKHNPDGCGDKLLADMQDKEPLLQNTIYGFRCLLFRKNPETNLIEFIGDGALNNDKSNAAIFGLECEGDLKDSEGNPTNITKQQKWEFLNNTVDLCKFKTDNFKATISYIKSDGTKAEGVSAKVGLESTYPDQGDLEKAKLDPDYGPLQLLYTWVYRRANFLNVPEDKPLPETAEYNGQTYDKEYDYRYAIFRNEFPIHFNLNHALVYYLFMEFTALTDNRAKNMFLRSVDVSQVKLRNKNDVEIPIFATTDELDGSLVKKDGEINEDVFNTIDWKKSTFAQWICDLYDLDSCFGVENSGYLQVPYYASWDYMLGDMNKFNGYDSLLWLMFEKAFAKEIEATARILYDPSSDSPGLNYKTFYKYHIDDNSEAACAAIVNNDMVQKYHSPWVDGYGDPKVYTSEYKYLQRGSRKQQKDSFIYKRFNMLRSKYGCATFYAAENSIHFRSSVDIEENDSYCISITASQAMRPVIRRGDDAGASVAYAVTDKIYNAGEIAQIKVPEAGSSDTVYIGGAPLITSIEGISILKPYEINISKAKSLKTFVVGSTETEYTNEMIDGISASGADLLEELNVIGCMGSFASLDLSSNKLIKKVVACGSRLQSITFPNGGVLEELYLGSFTKNIQVCNHSNLRIFKCGELGEIRINSEGEYNYTREHYDNVTSLHVENTPNIPTEKILYERQGNLEGIRLVGVNWDLTGEEWIKPSQGEATNVPLEHTTKRWKFIQFLLSEEIKGKFLDESGDSPGTTDLFPEISGTLKIGQINGTMYNKMKDTYPDLKIIGEDGSESVPDQTCTVTFYTDDTNKSEVYGWTTTLNGKQTYGGIQEIKIGSVAAWPGDHPSKNPTAQYKYSWDGWSKPETYRFSKDEAVLSYFNESYQTYKVEFYSDESCKEETQVGETIEQDYGTSVITPNIEVDEGTVLVSWKCKDQENFSSEFSSFILNEDCCSLEDGTPKLIQLYPVTEGLQIENIAYGSNLNLAGAASREDGTINFGTIKAISHLIRDEGNKDWDVQKREGYNIYDIESTATNTGQKAKITVSMGDVLEVPIKVTVKNPTEDPTKHPLSKYKKLSFELLDFGKDKTPDDKKIGMTFGLQYYYETQTFNESKKRQYAYTIAGQDEINQDSGKTRYFYEVKETDIKNGYIDISFSSDSFLSCIKVDKQNGNDPQTLWFNYRGYYYTNTSPDHMKGANWYGNLDSQRHERICYHIINQVDNKNKSFFLDSNPQTSGVIGGIHARQEDVRLSEVGFIINTAKATDPLQYYYYPYYSNMHESHKDWTDPFFTRIPEGTIIKVPVEENDGITIEVLSTANAGGYAKSDMREYLNEEMESFLPLSLRSLITPAKKFSGSGNRSTTPVQTEDKLFLFSPGELGLGTNAQNKYLIFSTVEKRTRKYIEEASLTKPLGEQGWTYWTREADTASSVGNQYIHAVLTDGENRNGIISGNNHATTQRKGVIFGFCL